MFPVHRTAIVKGTGAVVGPETASTLGYVTSLVLLGAGAYVGLKGAFLTGALLAVVSVPAGIATTLVLGGGPQEKA